MELVYNEEAGKWQEPYAIYHVLSEEEDKKLREAIRRGEHFRWHSADPEDYDMQDEEITVLTCISGDDGTVTYDHAFVLAEWLDDEEEWDFSDQIAARMKNVVVHGWMPLPEWED